VEAESNELVRAGPRHRFLVFVSSCLLGKLVRYDGQAKTVHHPVLERWHAENRIVAFCPEVEGGLPVPRPPAERVRDKVLRADGIDVTTAFERGAAAALAEARAKSVALALLKERSPSCGVHFVYDGNFSAAVVPGAGLTTECFRRAGIPVFSEEEFEAADALLRRLEASSI
jgi:uncharacterized protein YbbK (DUF523 family)